jgi:hypothetical protein
MKYLAIGATGLMVLSVGIYYGLIYSQAIDQYLSDDFHLLKTVIWLQTGDGPQQGWRLFFDQHNEHRIVFPRLFTWLAARVEGHVNFRTLNLIASLVTLGVAGLLALEFRKMRLHAGYFLPVVWLLFQPQAYDNLTYTISVIQMYGIVFLAFSVFKLLDGAGTGRTLAALVVAIIATFSHGNGMLTFAIGLVMLLLQRRFKVALGWSTVMVLCLVLYFNGLQKGQSGDWAGSLAKPVQFVQAMGVFAGAITEVVSKTDYLLPALFGWVLLLVLVVSQGRVAWNAWQGEFKKSGSSPSLFLLGCTLFLAGTALIVAVFRSWLGLSAMIQPRYVHFSQVLVAVAYLSVLGQNRQKRSFRRGILAIVLPVSLLLSLVAYWTYTPFLFERRQGLIADAYNWRYNQMTFGNHPSFDRNIREVYNTSIQRGISRPGTFFFADLQRCLRDSGRQSPKPIVLEATAFNSSLQDFKKLAWTVTGSTDSLGPGQPFLLLRNESRAYLVGTRPKWNALRRLLAGGPWRSPSFSAVFNSEPLPPGYYQLDVLLVTPAGVVTRYPSGQSFRVDP